MTDTLYSIIKYIISIIGRTHIKHNNNKVRTTFATIIATHNLGAFLSKMEDEEAAGYDAHIAEQLQYDTPIRYWYWSVQNMINMPQVVVHL